MGFLFISFIVSFAMQKCLHLSRSHVFIFHFISIILGRRSKNISLQFMSECVLPMFSSRSFIVSRSFCPLFDRVVCFSGIEYCMSCLSILKINSSVVSFAITFSYSEGCLFTLITVSFAVQKLLRLIRSHLIILFLFP